jgi:hypothetical protein
MGNTAATGLTAGAGSVAEGSASVVDGGVGVAGLEVGESEAGAELEGRTEESPAPVSDPPLDPPQAVAHAAIRPAVANILIYTSDKFAFPAISPLCESLLFHSISCSHRTRYGSDEENPEH